MKLLLCLLMPLAFISSALAKTNNKCLADTMDVSTIIDKSETAYHQLKIYLDSGKVISTNNIKGRIYKTAKFFKTAYANNGSFNFEYYELGAYNSLYTINRSANVINTWSGRTNKTETPTSLSKALIAAGNGSLNLSTIVPAILLTTDFNYNANVYHKLGYTELANSEVVNGVKCYVLKGNGTTIWVAETDFLIRKMEKQTIANPIRNEMLAHKIDSVLKINKLALRDTSKIRRDSALRIGSTNLMRVINEINNSHYDESKNYTLTDTYFYYPYSLKNPNPELFKFRPNREMGL